MKLTSNPLAVIILVILFGSIGITSALGWWATESSKQAAVFTQGEFAGLPNPADIRGSYTFGDIEKNFGVPAADLAAAFGIPADQDAAAFAVKSLEGYYPSLPEGVEIGTTSVRLFTALYTGLPFDLTDSICLPMQAVDLLKTKANLSAEQITYLDEHSVILPAAKSAPGAEASPTVVITPGTEITPAAESDRIVKGKTTFAEILGWGVAQSTIEQIIGAPLPNPLVKVKDFCSEQGLPFETIKTQLQAEIDKIPLP